MSHAGPRAPPLTPECTCGTANWTRYRFVLGEVKAAAAHHWPYYSPCGAGGGFEPEQIADVAARRRNEADLKARGASQATSHPRANATVCSRRRRGCSIRRTQPDTVGRSNEGQAPALPELVSPPRRVTCLQCVCLRAQSDCSPGVRPNLGGTPKSPPGFQNRPERSDCAWTACAISGNNRNRSSRGGFWKITPASDVATGCTWNHSRRSGASVRPSWATLKNLTVNWPPWKLQFCLRCIAVFE